MKKIIYLILFFIVPFFSSSQTLFRSGKFLHHSTGQNIWGPNGSSTSIPLQIQIYNTSHGYTGTNAVSMVEQQWPLHPWQNEWERWHRIFDNQDPQANILPVLAANKIVVIKSCFPSSEMTSYGQPSDTLAFTTKTVYNYKWHWRNFVNVMRQHPGNFFVIWTNAPHLATQTNPLAASLSKKFTSWAKDTLAQGLDPEFGEFPPNVYVFHYFAKLSDANGYELPQYGISSGDSHPNALATALIDPQFVNEIFDAAIAYEQGGTTLSVTPSSKNVTSSAGVTSFSVSCNTSWTVTSNAGWCSATPSGSGNGTINATYLANTGITSRTATLTISAPGAGNQTVTVIQAASVVTLVVTPANQNVAATAGNTTYTVVTSTNWSALSNAGWCTVTPSGTGNGNITANFTANTGSSARTATITVSATGTASQTVTVTQASTLLVLTAAPANQDVTAAAGSTTFSVTSNTNWTVQDNVSWCTFTPSGTGNGTITVNYTTNSGSTSRTATLTVSATGVVNVTLTVTQAQASATVILSATPSNQNVTFTAGGTSFAVTSNASWSVLSNSAWCIVTPSGNGNGTISANYTSNTGSEFRTAIITLSATGANNVQVTVTQSSSSPILVISPSNQSVTAGAGSAIFTVQSNIAWAVQSFSSWCTVTSSGFGNGVINANYSANTATSPRTATIKVSAAGMSNRMITVTQAGAPPFLTIAPPNQNVSETAGNKVFAVKSNTNWSAQSNSSWCSVTSNGSGNSIITANYAANPGASTRVATITLAANGVNNQYVTVTQAGIANKQSLVFENVSVPFTAGEYLFPSDLTVNYTIQSDAVWCQIVSTGSDIDGLMAVYEENILVSDRMALLTVSRNGSEPLTFSLFQSGRLTNSMVSDLNSIQMFPNPSDGTFKLLIANPDKKVVQVIISDLIGRLVYHETFTGDVSENPDLKKVGTGIYSVVITDGSSIQSRRIIIK